MRKVKPMKVAYILGEVYKPPYQTLSKVLEGKYSFAVGACPSEVTTDDDPPIRIEKNQEIIPVDGVLGLYDPEKRCITIYQKGIREVAQTLSSKEEDLELIVRLHEFTHAMLHMGLTRSESQLVAEGKFENLDAFFDGSRKNFESIDIYVHEVVAQLLTRMALAQLGQDAQSKEAVQILERINITFSDLMHRQPLEYNIHDDYKDVSDSRVTKAFDLLHRVQLPGKQDLFQTVMQW